MDLFARRVSDGRVADHLRSDLALEAMDDGDMVAAGMRISAAWSIIPTGCPVPVYPLCGAALAGRGPSVGGQQGRFV